MSTKETTGLDTNRFYNMLQEMQSNRWRITLVILGLFTLIIVGINSAVFVGVKIEDDWYNQDTLITKDNKGNEERTSINYKDLVNWIIRTVPNGA